MGAERKEPRSRLTAWQWAIRDSDLPANARLVAYTLSTYMSVDSRHCYPSVATLARGTGLGRSTVRRYLRVLERAGYVETTDRRNEYLGPSGGRYSSWYWGLLPETEPNRSGRVDEEQVEEAQEPTQRLRPLNPTDDDLNATAPVINATAPVAELDPELASDLVSQLASPRAVSNGAAAREINAGSIQRAVLASATRLPPETPEVIEARRRAARRAAKAEEARLARGARA